MIPEWMRKRLWRAGHFTWSLGGKGHHTHCRICGWRSPRFKFTVLRISIYDIMLEKYHFTKPVLYYTRAPWNIYSAGSIPNSCKVETVNYSLAFPLSSQPQPNCFIIRNTIKEKPWVGEGKPDSPTDSIRLFYCLKGLSPSKSWSISF